jgi:hypothetical protein
METPGIQMKMGQLARHSAAGQGRPDHQHIARAGGASGATSIPVTGLLLACAGRQSLSEAKDFRVIGIRQL